MDDRVTRKNWSAWEISTGNLSRERLMVGCSVRVMVANALQIKAHELLSQLYPGKLAAVVHENSLRIFGVRHRSEAYR